jgi:hypothetical protein
MHSSSVSRLSEVGAVEGSDDADGAADADGVADGTADGVADGTADADGDADANGNSVTDLLPPPLKATPTPITRPAVAKKRRRAQRYTLRWRQNSSSAISATTESLCETRVASAICPRSSDWVIPSSTRDWVDCTGAGLGV